MPARLHVDREAVRTLCVAIGITNASKQLGIPLNTLLAWSARGKWFRTAPKPQQPPTVLRQSGPNSTAINAINPSDALQNQLAEDSTKTRIGLAKAAKNAAETFQELPGTQVIAKSKALRDITAAASTLHGWEERKEGGLNLNIGVVIGGMGE